MYVTIKQKQYKVKEPFAVVLNGLATGIGFGVTLFGLFYLLLAFV